MTHTPGPWKAIKRAVNNDWLVIPCERERMPDSWILAECRQQTNDEANARLIAAAPDLLAALEYITQCNPVDWNVETARDMACSAIAKATGAKCDT